MPRINRRCSTTLMLTCAMALTGSLAVSPQAGAATIRACVKKTSGATRVVHGKAKCRKGEQSLSWNVTGPKGATGPTGPAGSNGANGAVAAFVAREPSTVSVTIAGKGNVILAKLLPPGNFVLSAKTTLTASSSKSTDVAIAECGMFDAPGTAPGSSGKPLDAAAWGAPLEKFFSSSYEAVVTLPFVASFNSTVASTVDLLCGGVGVETINATLTELTATQVSSLG